MLKSPTMVWAASVRVFVTLNFGYDIRVLRKLPRRSVGMLIITTSLGLYVLLLLEGCFHGALDEETAEGIGAYTSQSQRLMVGDCLTC